MNAEVGTMLGKLLKEGVPGAVPEYGGTPREGMYLGFLMEKETSEATYGDNQKTPETTARAWLIGGRPGEPVNSVYNLSRLRFQKHEALKEIAVGDLFIVHSHMRMGSNGTRYPEMSFFPYSKVEEGIDAMVAKVQ